ncbi:MAG: endonuclease/exonuclease/phosphatase family protein [Burkholderiaceae bacterium]|nr:endonuclease/exonuclease/phosphatase family protein [Burkholderiaceae bacterium]
METGARTEPDAAADPAQAPLRLRVLTVNTHKGFTAFNRRFVLHELREAVRAVSADIVFLQEVLGEAAAPARRARGEWPASQYEFLADSIWPQYAYGKNAVHRGGHHGNAVLSKFPIVDFENRDVSVSGRERRGLLHCVLQVPGRSLPVHAICVHLGLNEAQRRWQLERLCQQIEERTPADAPLIVAGDFNDWRLRAHARLRRCAGLVEVFVEATGSAARTFPARWPVLKLDRIYVRNARTARPVMLRPRPWSRLSDHAPLAAELVL